MLKEFRVQMDGSFTVWAKDADEACERGRNEAQVFIYVEETGQTQAEEDETSEVSSEAAEPTLTK